MINDILIKRRPEILEKWFNALSGTYSPQTDKFLRRETDPFANPVGASYRRCLSIILDELTGEMDPDNIQTALDDIIKIRAVQDLCPSAALSFMFILKQVLTEIFTDNSKTCINNDEWFSMTSKIDDITLRGFDIYMGCREKIYSLKAEEFKRTAYRFLEKARSDNSEESV